MLEPPLPPATERPRRLLDYLREMQRIAALDIVVAHTGHGEPIYGADVQTRVAQRLGFHQQRMDKLYGLFEGQPQHLYTLTQRLFPKYSGADMFLPLSETLGHLDLLEQDGRLVQETHGEITYWHPLP